MSRKFALIIGNTEYTDPGLAQLTAPGKDAEDFARVLQSKDICDFDDVKISLNEPSSAVIEAVDEFFDQKKPDDLLVLYFSGHGVKDEIGSLYLAFKNTVRSRLRSTAIKSDYIREAMDQSRSKRQVLILDCCNSGAFPQGTKAELGGAMGMAKAFQGYGRFVLTASDATQFAWEGDKIIGETDNSLFTHFLMKGLEGEADSDGDGKITVDELYDYAYHQISRVTPKQTPTKSSSKQEGEIILRENMRVEDIKPIALSDDLVNEIDDTRPYVREAAVQKLEKILKGKNIGLARSAREALEKIAEDENTTRRVAQATTQVLEALRMEEQKADEKRKAREEAEGLAMLKAEEERAAREKADVERLLAEQKAEEERIAKAKIEAEKLAIEKQLIAEKAKAEEERIAKAKIEAEQKATRLKAERETAKKEAEVKGTQKLVKLLPNEMAEVAQQTKNKPYLLFTGLIFAVGIIIVCYAGFSQINKTIEHASSTLNAGIGKYPTISYQATQNAESTAKVDKGMQDASATAYSYQATEDTSKATNNANATAFSANATDNAYKAKEAANATSSAQAFEETLKATDAANATAYSAQATANAKSFFESFDNNSSSWPTDDNINASKWSGSISIINGYYIWDVKSIKDKFTYKAIYNNPPLAADFYVSVDVKRISGTPEYFCYGIKFRNSGIEFYAFIVCDSQRFYVGYYDGKQWKPLQDWKTNLAIHTDSWNYLEISGSGNKFDFYINKEAVSQITDNSLSKGYIYLHINVNDTVPGEVIFDNFRIDIK